MDWNKTKTIFIVVFLILNVFLYSQYVGTYKEAQRLEVPSEKTIEAKLKEDRITYGTLPTIPQSTSYVSAKVKKYKLDELSVMSNQKIKLVNDKQLLVTFTKPIPLGAKIDAVVLAEFVNQYVYEGLEFVLWEIDEKTRTALFFQKVKDQTLFYNVHGFVKVYWNEKNEVEWYEQTILEKVEALEKKETILPAIQIIQALYAKNLLKPQSHIEKMKLGYSTVVQLTETQLLTPTWEIRVKVANGLEEIYFVNAIDGKVIDMEKDVQQIEEE